MFEYIQVQICLKVLILLLTDLKQRCYLFSKSSTTVICKHAVWSAFCFVIFWYVNPVLQCNWSTAWQFLRFKWTKIHSSSRKFTKMVHCPFSNSFKNNLSADIIFYNSLLFGTIKNNIWFLTIFECTLEPSHLKKSALFVYLVISS